MAHTGDIVLIPSGNWDEHVVISKSLMLMPAEGAVLKDLEINAPGQKITLLADLRVEGNIDFKQGYLYTGNHNVRAAATKGGSPESYMMMPPSGTLTLTVAMGATVPFPIGTGLGYAPVTVYATTNHVTDDITISVVDAANITDFTNTDPTYGNFARFEWNISEANTGTLAEFNLDFSFEDNTAGTKSPPMSFGATDIGHNLSGTWNFQPAVLTQAGGYYLATTTAVVQTPLSPFGVFACPDYSANLTAFSPYQICFGGTANLAVTITGSSGLHTVVIDTGAANITITGYTSNDSIPVLPGATTTYSLVSVTNSDSCTATTLTGTPTVSGKFIT